MKGLALGQKATVSRTFTPADVKTYHQLTGDSMLQFATPAGALPSTTSEAEAGAPVMPGVGSVTVPGVGPVIVPGVGPVIVPGVGPVIVPGPLLSSLFSQLLGTVLPGRGTNWLKQSLFFPNPARTGEVMTAAVEIVRLRPSKLLVNLRTTCVNPAGALVCSGEALVLVRDLQEVNM